MSAAGSGHGVRAASVRGRILYAGSRRIFPRLMSRLIHGDGNTPLADRLTRLGYQVNAVGGLQRLRRFPGFTMTRVNHDGLVLELVRPGDHQTPLSEGVILYFHGGGFIVGGLDSHLGAVVSVARHSHLPVVHVGYRQHPDATIDGSVVDCVRAYRWLLDQGADPTHVVVAGDSAGGFLAFATALAAQREGLPAPAGVVGISALLEIDNTARKVHDNFDRDAFGASHLLGLVDDVLGPPADICAQLSPITSTNLHDMPPALLIVAETEILRCDAERLHNALAAANKPCRLETWTHQVHGFPMLFPFLPESRQALEVMAQFVHQSISGTAPVAAPTVP